jgi:hypothetical protein
LWKIFDDNTFVPQEIRTRVSNAYRDLEHGGKYFVHGTGNPIHKVALAVEGMDSELVIDTLFEGEGNDSDGNQQQEMRRRFDRQEIKYLRSQIMHLRRKNCREIKGLVVIPTYVFVIVDKLKRMYYCFK